MLFSLTSYIRIDVMLKLGTFKIELDPINYAICVYSLDLIFWSCIVCLINFKVSNLS